MSKKTSGLYLYAAGLRNDLHRALKQPELPETLEPEAPFALITSAELAAVVSEVNIAEAVDDPLVVAERLMHHERAAEHFATHAAIVPFRFGVMYSGPEPIREMLKERHEQILRSLDRIEGCQEWGVNINVDRKAFAQAARSDLKDRQTKTHMPVSGRQYLLRKKAERNRAVEEKASLRSVAADVHTSLKVKAAGSAELEIKPLNTTSDTQPVARMAFLIRRGKMAAFKKELERLARQLAPQGFRFELTGPWPAYNFVE